MKKMKLFLPILALLLTGCRSNASSSAPKPDSSKTTSQESSSKESVNDDKSNNTYKTSSSDNQEDKKDDVAKDYKLEAEDIDLSYVTGGNTSASPSGSSLITTYDGASGGKIVYSLYVEGLFIEFEFNSSKTVDDAKLSFSFMASFHSFSMSNEEVEIFVNPQLDDDYLPKVPDERLKYKTLNISDTELKEFEIAKDVHLNEGKNTVYLYVNNSDSLFPTAATMNAKCPDIDYLKINTTSIIEQVKYSN